MIRPGSVRRGGFTLIEVIAALLIFSVGVLMVLGAINALSKRMEYAAVKSVINAQGQQRMDSLIVIPYASLSVGTTTTTVTVRGLSYTRQLVISQKSPLVRVLYFKLTPPAGSWPSYADSTFIRDVW